MALLPCSVSGSWATFERKLNRLSKLVKVSIPTGNRSMMNAAILSGLCGNMVIIFRILLTPLSKLVCLFKIIVQAGSFLR